MIAYFVHRLDTYSGAAQQALILAKSLQIPIIIFNNSKIGYKKYKLNKYIWVVNLPSNKILQAFIILYNQIKHKINIYHFHGFHFIGILISFLLNKKSIIKTTLLGDDDFDSYATEKKWAIRYFLLKRVSKNVVLTEKLKKINSKYIDSKKIIQIPNGVVLPNNCPTLAEKENLFCFVGLVCKRKNTYKSIKYFIENYSKDPTSKMLIVGPCSSKSKIGEFNENYYLKCVNLIKENKLEKRIIFTDLISKEETEKILKISKALLFFSDKEGMPNVVLEAMANNCVPITSELDGVIEEILVNKKHGFILSNLTKVVSVEQIEHLIKIKAPYNHISKTLAINIIAAKYKKLYK